MSSTIRLYFPDKIQSDLSSHLTKDQAHYLKDVMRLKEGDKLSIFNIQGEWNALIESYQKNTAKMMYYVIYDDKKISLLVSQLTKLIKS